ncbi:cytochrome c oxidase subunit 3 [Quercus suber]|uniref:Cytochrome c oxidase subunit 3 n=1 Tax=Quercus suber TaxID=58331 RepID=A0AAW0KRJ6_QUESU
MLYGGRCSMQIHFERTSYQSCTIRAALRLQWRSEGFSPKRNLGFRSLGNHFLNSAILLSSGAAVTWAHHATLVGKEEMGMK